MRTFLHAIFVVLFINFASCSLVRLAWGGKFILDLPAYSSTKMQLPRVYLISGLRSQPEDAYRFFDFSGYRRAYLRFSLLGYNPLRAGRQLEKCIEETAILCGLSIGAKAIECSPRLATNPTILINPCSQPQLLNRRRRLYLMLRYVMPVMEVVSFAMGWIAVLPLFKSSFDEKTSFALITDQLFWAGHGNPPMAHYGEQTGVIISLEDEWVQPELQKMHYRDASCFEISAPHGRIANPRYARQYVRAVERFLNQLKRPPDAP